MIDKLFRKSIPKKADIFTQSKNDKFYNLSYKPFKYAKKLGIIISSVVVLFGAAVIFVPGQQVSKAAMAMIACPLQNNGNNFGCNNWNSNWWANQNWNNGNHYGQIGRAVSNNDNNGDDNTYCTVNTTPINSTPFPQNNFVVATNPVVQPLPNISPVPQINGQNGQDIGGISSQLTAIQQQIAQQMQACANNAVQMANQIIQLQNQQKQLQQQIDAVNNQQMPNFDTSTTQGQQQQQAWQQQQQQKQQQLQSQNDALSNAISNAQNNMNNTNGQCQQNVSQLEQNRGQLESNLDQAFSNAMNIQIPQ
jgi:uncharacterized phage infection (PIP) family protein YhgE